MTGKWWRKASLYKRFTEGELNLDFSDEAAKAMFSYESHGKEKPNSNNGFLRGKMLQDITISLWKQDLKEGLLFKEELINDNYPLVFLNNILGLK